MTPQKRDAVGKKKKPESVEKNETEPVFLNIDALNMPMPATYINKDKRRRIQNEQ
jgi:hypothetical protein